MWHFIEKTFYTKLVYTNTLFYNISLPLKNLTSLIFERWYMSVYTTTKAWCLWLVFFHPKSGECDIFWSTKGSGDDNSVFNSRLVINVQGGRHVHMVKALNQVVESPPTPKSPPLPSTLISAPKLILQHERGQGCRVLKFSKIQGTFFQKLRAW